MDNISKEKIQFHSTSAIIINDSEGPETFPPHWHNAAEFTLVLEDGLKYRINDILYEAEKGDIILVWPHQIHETVKASRSGSVFIQFPSTVLESSLDLVFISRFLYACHHLKSSSDKVLCDHIQDKIREIEKIHNSSDLLAETKCKLCIYDIIITISERVLSEIKKRLAADKGSTTGWNYIHDACIYIVENSSENITQAMVAKHIGLSTFYFSKLFKQYMHMSFPAYLSNIRIKHAASLLLDETCTITECAFQAGFQSTTAFNKAFLDITGHSPREYRKLHK